MRQAFDMAAGSVTGRDHLRARRDGQDGFALAARGDVAVAVVTDGCSSGGASEVGARLGARWLARLALEAFPSSAPDEAARRIARALVGELEALARSLTSSGAGSASPEPALVGELLLFTWLAVVVAPPAVVVFGVGDGVVWIDGAVTVVDAGPENAPAYAAYDLLGSSTEPRVFHLGESAAVERVAIATDGAAELVDDGRLDALVREDRWFANGSLLRKRLLVLADGGACFDDTTIAIARRRP